MRKALHIVTDHLRTIVDEVIAKVERDRHVSSHDTTKELSVYHQTSFDHLKKAEDYTKKKKKPNISLSRELT